jgi:anthranilate/para-aminobenzoate synthase component I
LYRPRAGIVTGSEPERELAEINARAYTFMQALFLAGASLPSPTVPPASGA